MTIHKIIIRFIIIFFIFLVGVTGNFIAEEYANSQFESLLHLQDNMADIIQFQANLNTLQNNMAQTRHRFHDVIANRPDDYAMHVSRDIGLIIKDFEEVRKFSTRYKELDSLILVLGSAVRQNIDFMNILQTYHSSGKGHIHSRPEYDSLAKTIPHIDEIINQISLANGTKDQIVLNSLVTSRQEQKKRAETVDQWAPVFMLIFSILFPFFLMLVFRINVKLLRRMEGSEKELLQSLKGKSILIKELHHRVKNNLQMMSSILFLKSQSVKDQEIRNMLGETRQRIRSIALVHEHLMMTTQLDRLDMREYLKSLLKEISISYGMDAQKVTLHVDIDELDLNIDFAINCGFIINEGMTNIFKYAFPGDRKGEAYVSLKRNGNGFKLEISDNGVGFPDHISPIDTNLFGVQLITVLAKQMKGNAELQSNNGTTWTITC